MALADRGTVFVEDEVVVATSDAQGMKKGKSYVVWAVDERRTPFGNFVTYELVDVACAYPKPKDVLRVGNLHLLARPSRSAQ